MNKNGKKISLVMLIGLVSTIFTGCKSMMCCDSSDTKLTLTTKWDKTFAKSDKVNHEKITFKNKYGFTLAADMYIPKNADAPFPAIAISGPFGACKEQSSGLYAQKLAELGYLTIAFDPSFSGESEGEMGSVAAPNLCTEDFQAAVDFLSTNELVDSEKIGILGICGWGGFAVNTASLDQRIKATVAITMYDMTRVTANGYNDKEDSAKDRAQKLKALSLQRTADKKNGKSANVILNPKPADDAPKFLKDYYDYYKTPRGYHARSINSNNVGWHKTACLPLFNSPIMQFNEEIESAVLLVYGAEAHSRYFSEDTFKTLKGDNKKLVIVPGASHVDLYDNFELIPLETIDNFFKTYLVTDK